MSDNWITLIPEDPNFIPEEANREHALRRFLEIAPDADEIAVKVCKRIEFFDCGQNFERINCPSCFAQVKFDWWQDRMSDDWGVDDWYHRLDEVSGNGFKLDSYPMPCCGQKHALHELKYNFAQGFARFALDVMNANIGELDEKFKLEFEAILGTKLRVIYQRI